MRFGTLRGDFLNQIDMGVQRQFKVTRYGTVQFRCEAINLLNHPVYSLPSSADPNSSSWDAVTGQANQPRVYQFAAFIRF